MKPLRFISKPIDVEFDRPPVLEKAPTCPDRFRWDQATYAVVEVLESWSNFERNGRMGRNMRPENAAVAVQRGSWGVGRFHFHVRTECGRFFALYYDRAPAASAGNRKGGWFLFHELNPDDS